MRRKDRCVSDQSEILDIIKKCEVCNVAFYDEGFPYIVPLNFGVSQREGMIELYFHCAKVGKKLDLLRANNHVAFSMTCSHKLILEEAACESTMEYESVCGNGILKELGDEDKVKALNILMKQYSGRDNYTFPENELRAVAVLKLTVNEIAGKRLKKQ
jgi:nitroimidazol reductase NimA-like FMN-containing flavoprotein (pyridoxamine 5'-phosphate oxidase superfamily)